MSPSKNALHREPRFALLALLMAACSSGAFAQEDESPEQEPPEQDVSEQEPQGQQSISDRPSLRFSYGTLTGQYSDQQHNLVTEVSSRTEGLPISGQSIIFERYIFRDEYAEASDAWYLGLAMDTLKPRADDWQQSKQMAIRGGYTLPFIDPKTFVMGFRLLTNDRKVDAAVAPDVTLSAQMAAVVGFEMRQRLVTTLDDLSLYIDGKAHYLLAGGNSHGTDLGGHIGVTWDLAGLQLDIALGMVDQVMNSTAKVPDHDGELAITTHYAARHIMVALWL